MEFDGESYGPWSNQVPQQGVALVVVSKGTKYSYAYFFSADP